MALPEAKVSIKAIKNGKEIDVYTCTWNGDLGDWIDIGGEVGAAIVDYNRVTMTLTKKKG